MAAAAATSAAAVDPGSAATPSTVSNGCSGEARFAAATTNATAAAGATPTNATAAAGAALAHALATSRA